jgi:hypothetical protein
MRTLAMEVKAVEKEFKELIEEMNLAVEKGFTEEDNKYFTNKIKSLKRKNKRLQELIGEVGEDIEYEEVVVKID